MFEKTRCSACDTRRANVDNYLKTCGSPKKLAKTAEELVAILKKRGLCISNEDLAMRRLRECHYYRLMAYRFPFVCEDDADKFRPGTNFSDIWNLYVFDRRLRLSVLDAIERVETALRSRWACVLGLKYGALAYENAGIHSGVHFQNALWGIYEAIATSKEPCIVHFREDATFPQRIPIWSVCEILTQGQLFTLINCLTDRKSKDEIFAGLGLDTKRMSSFLNVLRNVRNICAHHGRLWNKQLFFEMKFPKNPKPLADSLVRGEKSVFNVLTVLAHLLQIIAPQSQWHPRLCALVRAEEDFVRTGMGFPCDWRERPIWRVGK